MDTKYKKGEFVIYGTNGIYCIEDIKELDFSKEKGQIFYVLKPMSNKHSTVYVPVDNENLTKKMRFALTKAEIDSLLGSTKGKYMDWIEDRNGRANFFHNVLNKGVQEELLLMIHCIYDRKKQLLESNKKLSVTDENALRSAEQQIREEFTYSLSM